MTLGALTAVYVGCENMDSAAFKALIDSVNVGAATAGAEVSSLLIIPVANSGKACVWQVGRAAS